MSDPTKLHAVLHCRLSHRRFDERGCVGAGKQRLALIYLCHYEGHRLGLTDLARMMGCYPSCAFRAVQVLMELGLVNRAKRYPADTPVYTLNPGAVLERVALEDVPVNAPRRLRTVG